MFDTMKTAKIIRDARIRKNLTQMNLADAMSVSYQAVSNWERGNSMPDISKLEEICRVLDLSVSELLGVETQASQTVEKILAQEEAPLTMEELSKIVPLLAPEQVKEQARKSSRQETTWDVEALAEIAPFLDEEFLEEMVDELELTSLGQLTDLAPFLSEEALDRLVRKAPLEAMDGMDELLPFLKEETLNFLAKQSIDAGDGEMLEQLLPFLDEESVDALAVSMIQKGKTEELSRLYPFMGDDALHTVARELMKSGDLQKLRNMAPFL